VVPLVTKFESQYVAGYVQAEELSGWEMLRHPDVRFRDIRITTSDDIVTSASQTMIVDGTEFTLIQGVDDDGVDGASLEILDVDSAEGQAGPYTVTYSRHRFADGIVALFETGAAFEGKPVVAEVTGPDMASIALFISQLTFRD
jgi:hypothetical protein